MNKSNLKSYAPQARRDFIAAVTSRANQLGISATHVSPLTLSGDVALIDGAEWPAKVGRQREKLLQRIQRHGFAQTMEEVAYTWFNRFAALRYMELHDFLDHGHRVLSSRDGGLPELLRNAAEVTLPGLSAAKVQEMQLAGNRDDELYKLLLVAQCNELSRGMPFLFERIDDDTELLLPDNLLRTDSIVAKLVAGVPEEDWQKIEVIGWLYQFYISEKKDEVIGKVVKSEDIPAATQLFTPNWIVQYLVQNSVGRLWLMANPTSTLASEWPYYVQPAEQTPEVQAQLDALIKTRIREDGDALNPESITVLDPACGSGHILVVAYDVLKAIYLERGYRLRDIPRLILEKNLYGLDIDDRAAQMAGFALLMKARADDRRLLNAPENPPRLNVLSLQESKGLNYEELSTHLAPFGVQRATLWGLIEVFEHAKTFGSLIQIPYQLKTHLDPLAQVLELAKAGGDMYGRQAAQDLQPFVMQAQLLAMQFDAVVANPPYMGSGFMDPVLKTFIERHYQLEKGDLFSCFIRRGEAASVSTGLVAFVTMQSWMFLSNYESFRRDFLSSNVVSSLLHLGNGVMGIAFGTCATVFQRSPVTAYTAKYIQIDASALSDTGHVDLTAASAFERNINHFRSSPGLALAYSLDRHQMALFNCGHPISEKVEAREGLTTADNVRFLRYWWEVNANQINRFARSESDAKNSPLRWYPYQKGGEAVKWFGNNEWVVDWKGDGAGVKGNIDPRTLRVRSHNYNGSYSFREGITWSSFSNGGLAFRYVPAGSLFDSTGSMAFASSNLFGYLALLNTSSAFRFLKAYSPSPRIKIESLLAIPDILESQEIDNLEELAQECVHIASEISRHDEVSPGFAISASDLISVNFPRTRIKAWIDRIAANESLMEQMLSEKFGFPEYDAIEPGVSGFEFVGRQLISYAIGCMMGRYSLDEPGLIYAHAGNVGFDPGRYARFPADADGILPVTDEHWFEDDAPARVSEFLQTVWGPDTLAENLAWLAESLGTKGSETPEETILRYIADKFYKDHLQTYKKRPIYWLFSSGKHGAFQALVYLHRYHEGTLARMRAEYVIPLTAKMAARLEMLEQDANAANSAATRTKVRKQIETLRKKQAELLAFDEKLRHYADMRITLDLDDGVKVNYGKFGDLLDSVKVVTGGSGDD